MGVQQRLTAFTGAPCGLLVIGMVVGGIVATSTGTAAPAPAQNGDLFDRLYKQGHQKNGNLRTLTASFAETTESALLTKPLVARGTVAAERPSRILIRYEGPEERSIRIDGNRMTISWPARAIDHVRDIDESQRRIQKYFVTSSPDELRSHFRVSARETGGSGAPYLITMTPKRKQIQEGLTNLELWVDRSSLLPTAMRMTFPGGDIKTMTFTDLQPNVPVERWFVPGGRASTESKVSGR